MAQNSVQICIDSRCGTTFGPGQNIFGYVQLTLAKEITVTALKLTFKGRSKVRFTVKHGKNRTTYTNKELYFHEQLNLFGGSEDVTVQPGTYEYPFLFLLPENVPSSLEAQYGNIRYTLKAVLDRPWRFDFENKLALSVINLIDLNLVPQIRTPIYETVEKTVTCCCTSSGNVNFTASLPVRGYVPGEKIEINCHVENYSNSNVDRITIFVENICIFTGKSVWEKTKVVNTTIARVDENGIGAHGEKTWISKIAMPNINPPNLSICKIIDNAYILVIKLIMPVGISNIKLRFPILFGHVPLNNGIQERAEASAPPFVSTPSSPPPDYFDAVANSDYTKYP